MLNVNDVLNNRYRIKRLLGEGGMGAVYLAEQPELKREVALKVLSLELARNQEFVTRFQREAHAMAALRHPHIVEVFDADVAGDYHYLAMEYLPGGTLQQFLAKRGPLPVNEALSITRQIALALDYAHSRGFVHRDIKPSNIMIAADGRFVLTDFGIVLPQAATKLTRTIATMGTPEYMSPEQAQGQEVDGRSDLYSLGIMLYEMLSGKPPFSADTPYAVIYKQVRQPLPAITHTHVPPAVGAILNKVTAKNPQERYQTAAQLVGAIDHAIRNPAYKPHPQRATWIALGVLVGVAVLVVSIVAFAGNGQANVGATPGVTTLAQVNTPLVAPSATSLISSPPAQARTATLAPAVATQTPQKATETPIPPTETNSPVPPSSTPVAPVSVFPTVKPVVAAQVADSCSPKWFFSPAPVNEGCPQNNRSASAALQVYEKGRILWLGDADLQGQVFVFYNSGAWENVSGSIDSVGSAPDKAAQLGQPSGGRASFTACAAHSNVNGVVTAYVSDGGGNILSWSISAGNYSHLGWRYVSNVRFIGCG